MIQVPNTSNHNLDFDCGLIIMKQVAPFPCLLIRPERKKEERAVALFCYLRTKDQRQKQAFLIFACLTESVVYCKHQNCIIKQNNS